MLRHIADPVLDWLSPTVMVPLHRTLIRDRTARYLREASALDRASDDALRGHQLSRLQAVCSHASKKCPFYADRLRPLHAASRGEIAIEAFQRLPLLTRQDLRDHGDSIRSRDIATGSLRLSATGGTTASPIPICMDWEAFYHRRAATVVADRRFGYEPGGKLALLWGAAQDLPRHRSWRFVLRNTLIDRTCFLASSPLDEAIADAHLLALRRFRPHLLQAYPSPLAHLARRLLSTGSTLPTPAISCTAEPLLPHHRQIIERAFLTSPRNWYGSREFGRVATQRPNESFMRVNGYGVLLEVLPDATDPDGLSGRIVLTDLWNTGFPLIRYDTGDRATLMTADDLHCWSVLRLSDVSGRTVDDFVNSKGQIVSGVSFTNRVLKQCDEVQELQITQLEPTLFQLTVVPGPRYSAETARQLTDQIWQLMGERSDVRLRIASCLPLEASGKVRLCRSLVGAAHPADRLPSESTDPTSGSWE